MTQTETKVTQELLNAVSTMNEQELEDTLRPLNLSMAELQLVFQSRKPAKKGKVAKAKAEKAEKPAKPEPKVPVIMPARDGQQLYNLSDFMPLEVFPNGDLAMRERQPTHVEHILIALENGDDIPPIQVVRTDIGPVIIDGYHRKDAYEKYLIQTLISDGTLVEEKTAQDKELNEKRLQEERKDFTIPAVEGDYEDVAAIIDAAFRANLLHGLPAGDPSRGRYGLWYYNRQHALGNVKFSLHDAGKVAGCSHQAIMKARNRMLGIKKTAKMVDSIELDEEDLEVEAELAETSSNGTSIAEIDNKHVKALIAAMKHFHESGWADLETRQLTDGYKDQVLRPALAKCSREESDVLAVVVSNLVDICYSHDGKLIEDKPSKKPSKSNGK